MSDQEHEDTASNRCERDEAGDTEAKNHSLIDSQAFDPESQHASRDEVPSQDDRIGHAASAPLYQYAPEESESDRLVQLRRMHRHGGRR